ncbi:fam-a protein, fragment [Plasmodium vinckei]|uniref:Fam-a protein n=1 Tax=Plasmodium vinckei TaxID=5860 RepID=A0A6V7TGW9_PLAVN|nr:fam-a protein, fragment [Plasmodium vinckei]
MNKFYIQIVFFLLSIFICVNNKTLATVPTPKKKNNKTLPTVVTPKEQNNKTFTTNLISREQIDKILATEPTPREQINKIMDAIQKTDEQNKRNGIYFLSPEERAIVDAKAERTLKLTHGRAYNLKEKLNQKKQKQ